MSQTTRVGLLLSSMVAATVLAGCSGGTLDWRNAQVNNGKVYEGNSNKPFSGKVTNVPFGTVYTSQPGYQKIAGQAGAIISALFGSSELCDVEVDDGELDGDVVCRLPQSDIVQTKGHFDKGTMAGSFAKYDRAGKNVVFEASFKDGQPDGEIKRYSPATGKLVVQESISVGVADGPYKEWDGATGNQLVDANFSHGLLNGAYEKKDADGNEVAKGVYAAGKFTGTEAVTLYYLGTKKPGFEIAKIDKQYEGGVVQNAAEVDATNLFSSDVTVCVEDKYPTPSAAETPMVIEACKQQVSAKKSAAMQADAASTPDAQGEDRNDWPKESNACTTQWEAAFRKANGPDSTINYQQEWEFVDNCRAGKSPQS